MNYIDTHCHLDLLKDIQLNKKNEDELGIKTITVTNAPSFYTPNQKLFENASNIRVALGLHPQIAHQYENEIELFEHLVSETRYIGEIGLDGSAEFKQTYQLQFTLFSQILKTIKLKQRKILTIHSRNAASDTIEALSKELRGTDHKIILHWYSGSISDLKVAISKGFFFSINHKMVASEKGKQIISHIPNHLLLTETDAPFSYSAFSNNRIKSLTATLEGLSTQKEKLFDETRNMIYENFKNLIS